MNGKQLFTTVITMVWNIILTIAFGLGFALTVLNLLPTTNLGRFAFYSSLVAQSYLFINFAYIALKAYLAFKKELNRQKQVKLDKELVKRAAEIVTAQEEKEEK
jgi:hypothetical protein